MKAKPKIIFNTIVMLSLLLGMTAPALAKSAGSVASQPEPAALKSISHAGLAKQAPAPKEQPNCALLDNPKVRGLMSGAFESGLLRACGRSSELGKSSGAGVVKGLEQAAALDVLVNDPATDSPATALTQSETTLARNPNTGTICSVYNDDGQYAANGVFTGYSRSTDGGATFTDMSSVPLGQGQGNWGDPSVVFRAADGKFYLTTLWDGGGLGLYRSDDDCMSWTFVAPPSNTGGDDKEFLAVDNSPSSPYYGRLYVAWTDFSDGRITLKYSSDAGATWSAAIRLSGFNDVQGAWPTVAPNGDVYVGWVRWNPWPSGPIDIEIVRSTDGGASFSLVTNPLTGGGNPWDDTATANCGRPALNGDIRYLPSPQLVVSPNGQLHVIYTKDPDGHGTGDVVSVYYRKSTDNGASWGPELLLNDDGTTTDQWFPTISAGPANTIVATWYDRRNDPANNYLFDYYQTYSADSGNSWLANARITDVSSPVAVNFDPNIAFCYHGDYDQQVQDTAFAYIQWSDDRLVQNGINNPNIFFEKVPVSTEIGTLQGTVTDASTSDPIAGATVEATDGTLTFQATTNGSGFYSMVVISGTYDVTASAFGYLPETVLDLVVGTGATVTQDFALDPAPAALVFGYITDSSTGWPLYASFDIAGVPGGPFWNDPVTGYYEISLPQGSSYDFTVNAWVPGYMTEDQTVGPLSGDIQVDFDLDADQAVCTAPGYLPSYNLINLEDFEADNGGYTQGGTNDTWAWGVPTNGPGNAHSGVNVWATGLTQNYLDYEDAYIESPDIDLSPYAGAGVRLSWWDWQLTETCCDYTAVLVSNDGGVNWTQVFGPEYEGVQAWTQHEVILASSYAVSNFRVRFFFHSDGSVTYPGWFIDDVSIEEATCLPPEDGGLVVGNVYDTNLGMPLTGADVTNDTGGATTTAATADPNVDDSFYTLFSPSGTHDFTAAFPKYNSVTTPVGVVDGDTVLQDFFLPSGYLVVDPTFLHTNVPMGDVQTVPMTLTNLGDGAVNFEIREVDKGYIPTAGQRSSELPKATGPAVTLEGSSSPEVRFQPSESRLAAGSILHITTTDTTGSVQRALNELGYTYDLFQGENWTGIDFSPYDYVIIGMDGGAVDSPSIQKLRTDVIDQGKRVIFLGGTCWQSFVQGVNQYLVLNDLNNYCWQISGSPNWTVVNPSHPMADGLPLSYNFTNSSAAYYQLRATDPDLEVVSVNGDGYNDFFFKGQNFPASVTANGSLVWFINSVYSSYWTNQADFDVLKQIIFNAIDYAGSADVPWLSESPISGTIPASFSQLIDVTFDATGIGQPGDYLADLRVKNDTPYGDLTVPVTMTVAPPPGWGKLQGTVSSLGYCDAENFPLEGAVVVIESSLGVTYTLETDAAGYYSWWLDSANGPYTVSVTYPEHQDGLATGVDIDPNGGTTTVDFDLRWLKPCVSVDPLSLEATLDFGQVVTQTIDLTNDGAAGTPFEIKEQDRRMTPGLKLPKSDGNFPRGDAAPSYGPAPVTGSGAPALSAPIRLPQGTLAYSIEAVNSYFTGFDLDVPEELPNLAPYSIVSFPGAGEYVDGFIYVVDGTTMKKLDPSGALVDTLSVTPPVAGQDYTGMALDPTDGTVFLASCDISTSNLYTIDLETGTVTQIGQITNSPCTIGIAVDGSGDMYSDDIVNDTMLWIDKTTGAGTVLGSLGFDANFGQGMGWDQATDTLYLAAFNGSTFQAELRIGDRTTGNTTLVGVLGQTTPGFAQVPFLAVPMSVGGDVPWLREDPTTGYLDPDGGTQSVDVVFDANYVGQPGDYFANLRVKTDDPVNGTLVVPVTMTVNAPADWGKLEGTVTSLGYCDANPTPAVEAEVLITSSSGMTWTVMTDDQGYYSWWLDEADSPYTVAVTYPEHEGGEATGVVITGGDTTTVNFDLRWLEPCVSADPSSFDFEIGAGYILQDTLNIFNTGAEVTSFEIKEQDLGMTPPLGLVTPQKVTPVESTKTVTVGDLSFSASQAARVPAKSSPVRLPNAPGAVTITHSVSQDIQQFNSVACNNGFAHTDNSYLRVFTLSDFGIDTDFAVTNVEIGIEQATGAGGDQPATVNLYTLEGPLLWANLTLIGSAPVSVDDQALTIINMPVEGVATGGSTLVVEFFTPDGNAEGNLLFVGSNNLGQTGLTYLAAADCGVPEPTDTGTLGFPDMHLVMNVTGEAGSADVLWMSEEPVTGTIDADSTADIAMTFDSMTYTVGTQLKALLKVKSDDPVNGTINIPVTMTVAAPAFGVDVGPDQALSERPAKTVTYQVTVMNTSNGPEDTFDIEAVSGNGWTTTAPATVGPLGPGESETIDVVVAIPSDAVPGDTDAAVLTATSQGDSGVSDSATLTTTVTGEYGVVITPPEAAATGLPGEMVTYTLSVMNTGDVTATFGITYTGNTWAVQLSDTSLEIGAGESVELLVSVSIPVAAENGDSDGVTVSANGIGGATDSSVLTTTVLIPTRFVYLPLVMDGYNAP